MGNTKRRPALGDRVNFTGDKRDTGTVVAVIVEWDDEDRETIVDADEYKLEIVGHRATPPADLSAAPELLLQAIRNMTPAQRSAFVSAGGALPSFQLGITLPTREEEPRP